LDWHYSVEFRKFNIIQKSVPESSYKTLQRKVLPKLEIHCTSHVRNRVPKITFFPPFFMLSRFTDFNILVNLRSCEPGGGLTKTDISDELRMENRYSDENVSTSKMTINSREVLLSLS